MDCHFLALVHGSNNHLFRTLHNVHWATQPKWATVEPTAGPSNSRTVDLLTALQRVSHQITYPALGQQRQPILAQVCMAAAPLLRNFTTIDPGQIRSASRLAFSSGPAGNGTAWLPT